MAKDLNQIKEELQKAVRTAEAQSAKQAKYRVKNADGGYDVIHLETSANQVIESEEKQFISAAEKASLADKYTKEEMDNMFTEVSEAVTAVDGKVDTLTQTVADNQTAMEGALSDAVDAIADQITGMGEALTAADEALDGRITELETLVGEGGNIREEIERVETKVDEYVTANDERVSDLEESHQQLVEKHASDIETLTQNQKDLYLKDSLQGSAIENIKLDLEQMSQNVANGTSDLENKISDVDAKVTAETERAQSEEAAIRTELADGLATKVNVSDVVNNLTTEEEGKVLDARQGKVLSDAIVTESERAVAAEEALAGEVSNLAQVVADNKTAIEETVASVKSDLESSINDVNVKAESNAEEIQKLKDVVGNKNSNTIVVSNMEEFEGIVTAEDYEAKIGDLVFVLDIKKTFIYKGATTRDAMSLPTPPMGWVYFDEITTEVDLVDYLKAEEAAATYRRLDTAINESDLTSELAEKINDKANSADVADALALKADQTTVEAELAKKLDSADVAGIIKPLEDGIAANAQAIADEVSAREDEIERVEGLIDEINTDLSQTEEDLLAEIARLELRLSRMATVVSDKEPQDTEQGHIWLEIQ